MVQLTFIILPANTEQAGTKLCSMLPLIAGQNDLPEYEIIVARLCDSSRREELPAYPGVRWVEADCVPKARQLAIQQARGHYLLFLRASDRILVNAGGALRRSAALDIGADLIIAGSIVQHEKDFREYHAPVALEECMAEEPPARLLQRFLIKNMVRLQDGQYVVAKHIVSEYQAASAAEDYVQFGCYMLERARRIHCCAFPLAILSPIRNQVRSPSSVVKFANEVFSKERRAAGVLPLKLKRRYIAAIFMQQAHTLWQGGQHVQAMCNSLLALMYFPRWRVFSSQALWP